MLRNLATRESEFATVSLDFNPASKSDPETPPVSVHVVSKSGEDFTLYPDPAYALDCFRHPYAYARAALNGKTAVAT